MKMFSVRNKCLATWVANFYRYKKKLQTIPNWKKCLLILRLLAISCRESEDSSYKERTAISEKKFFSPGIKNKK